VELQQHTAILTVTVIISIHSYNILSIISNPVTHTTCYLSHTVDSFNTGGSTQQPPGSTLPTTTPPTIGCMGAKWWPSTTRPMVCNTQALGCYDIVTIQLNLSSTAHMQIFPCSTIIMTVFKQNGGCGYNLKPQVHSNCKCLCRWVVRGA